MRGRWHFEESYGQQRLIVDGAVPSLDEVRAGPDGPLAVRVSLLPPESRSLDFLQPIADRIVRFSSSGHADHAIVSEMLALEHLDISGALRRPVSVRRLTRLRSLRFRHEDVRDLGASTSLHGLVLRLRASDQPPGVAAPIVDASIVAANRSVIVRVPDWPSARPSLRQVHLALAGRTVLTGLDRYAALEVVSLENTPLEDVQVLSRLDRLRVLVLADVHGVDDLDALARVRADEVRVIGLGAFCGQLADRFDGLPHWTFPPGLADRRRRRVAAAARRAAHG